MEDPRKILGSLAIIYRSYLACMEKELEAYKIRSGQFDFLMVLYRKDGISQDTIAKALKVSKATTTRAIKNLETEGYVYRERDGTDLRAYRVYLTEKGKEVRNVILEKSGYFVDNLLSDFKHEEKKFSGNWPRKPHLNFMNQKSGLLFRQPNRYRVLKLNLILQLRPNLCIFPIPQLVPTSLNR